LKFDHTLTDLPISEIIPDIQKRLANENTLIVHAPPGAGKSTVLPIALKDEDWLDGKKIVMLEPRRLATRTIASRMSALLNDDVGRTVGYKVRFENKCSSKTKIEVITEGILTRMLIGDNALEDVGMVIFDEFHERSIHADVALALCREAQQVLRPDLRIVVMSATLNISQLNKMLSAEIVSSKGRQYPVDVQYLGNQDMLMLPEVMSKAILDATKKYTGDLLAFLPGQAEIKKSEELLKKALPDFSICPLYGQLPQGAQFKAIVPDRNGKRKIVLATSIAETSLTIEGVSIVVDSGYGRVSRFDPRSGLSRLETVQIAKDSADQRAGRAGRLGPGVCIRLWSLATHDRLPDHREPEIVESDLANLVLDLAEWGIDDIYSLKWLTPPPQAKVDQASEILHQLEALDDGKITDHGKKMHALPCHPRIAHTLVMAEEEGLQSLACDLASLLEDRDPLPQGTGIDINIRIEALRKGRKEKRLSRKFLRIEKIASSYRKIMHCSADNSAVDPYETGLLLTYAYPERIACARPGNNALFQLANGKYAEAGHRDNLAHESWLAVAQLDARNGTGKIFLASPLNPKDLAHLVKTAETIKWDSRKGGLLASKDVKIGNIVLQSSPLADPCSDAVCSAICEAVEKEGEQLLGFDSNVQEWQSRVMSLKKWRPEEDWDDVSTDAILKRCKEWLPPYLTGVKKNDDLKRLDLAEILHASLAWEFQQQLDVLAPARIKVPSGSNLKIQYDINGGQPILSVRIQEIFGLAETPCVNEGRNPILLHLLSPGFKPVQVTADLHSFWNSTYFEVKKELKIRYPKHVWPEDPWNEPPIRGVKRKPRS